MYFTQFYNSPGLKANLSTSKFISANREVKIQNAITKSKYQYGQERSNTNYNFNY